ncbi:RimK family alpha-L-glutamate ligase [Streptomyces sp. NPDC101150]|uniref:ATP-grasp domain-containing protein n=1 Tax=Streptomyces sp. NPDC101150 TaxID=3366114 RepID=UPI0037F178EC
MSRGAAPDTPHAQAGGTVAVISDRLGWEERQLLRQLPTVGLQGQWLNDESLCLGITGITLPGITAAVIRSRSYTRGRMIATLLHDKHIPTLNSPQAIQKCENKLDLLLELSRAGLPVSDCRLVLSRKDLHRACDELGLPFVVKPLYGGRGRRVLLLRDRDLVDATYDCIEDLAHGFEQACLAEPFLEGAPLRILVVGDRPLAAVHFSPSPTDWRSNAATGGTPALHHDPGITDLAKRVVGVLGPGIYGVDVIQTADGPVVGEVNHAPGYRALSSVAPCDVTAAIAEHLQEMLS